MSKILYQTIKDQYLTVRAMGDDQELKEIYQLLTDFCMCPINYSSHMLCYSYRELLEGKAYQTLISQQGMMDKIVPLTDVPEDLIGDFLEEHPEQAIYFTNDWINPACSSVCIWKDKIMGIAYAEIFADLSLCIPALYFEVVIPYEKIVPFLLMKTISYASTLEGVGAHIVFCPLYQNGYNGMLSMFGEPLDAIPVHEYAVECKAEHAAFIKEQLQAYSMKHSKANEYELFKPYLESQAFLHLTSLYMKDTSFLTHLRMMPDEAYRKYKKQLFVWYNKWTIDHADFNRICAKCGAIPQEMNIIQLLPIRRKYAQILDAYHETGELPSYEKIACSPEDIQYFRMDKSHPILRSVLPENMIKAIQQNDYLILGAMTKKHEVVGLLLMDVLAGRGDTAFLKYVTVSSAGKDVGVEERMMDIAKCIALESGMHFVYHRMLAPQGSSLKAMTHNYVFVSAISEKANVKTQLPGILFANECQDEEQQQLDIICQRLGCSDADSYDATYSAVYVKDKTVRAVALALKQSENELVVFDYIGLDDVGDEVPLRLYETILKRALETMPKDSLITIRTYQRAYCKNLCSLMRGGYSLDEYENLYALTEEKCIEPAPGLLVPMPMDLDMMAFFCENLEENQNSVEKQMVEKVIANMLLSPNDCIPSYQILWNKEQSNEEVLR